MAHHDSDPPPPDGNKGVSRRGFLQGTGLSLVTGALLRNTAEAAGEVAKAAAPTRVLGPDAVPIELSVNGQVRKLTIEPRTTLAEALRTGLGLTGTKIGCDRGACSACTVHLDGQPAASCMTLALDVASRGAKVTTVEGLATGEALHPVQQAFIDHDAMQCGYCTPGMVMSCAALLGRTAKPSLDEVKGAVSGNLCRCGTYPKVFAATLAASGQAVPPSSEVAFAAESLVQRAADFKPPEGEPPAWPARDQLSVVGRGTPRLDGKLKVTGAAKYTSDVQLPGMLYARRVAASFPHGRVTAVDTTRAAALPGVKAVFVVEKNREGARLQTPAAEKFPTVRYAGQTLAAVCATSQAIADEAARLVRIDYEPLPFVVDLDAARREGAPLVYAGPTEQAGTGGGGGAQKGLPQKGNVRGPAEITVGDVAAGWKQAEVTVEGEFRTQVQTHSAMETHGVVADWKPDGLTVWASTQSTANVRDELAEVFDLPKSKVRVVCEFMGGGFGAKFGAGSHGILAAELSRRAGAPVRLMLDRKEEHTAVGNRPSSLQQLKIGARKDGTLVAMELSSWGTAGAGLGAGVGPWTGMLYPAKAFRSAQHDVFTHATPGCAFRAPGAPQSLFAVEQLVDELADQLGIDPLDLRDRIDSGDARSDREARRRERRIGAERVGWSKHKRRGASGLATSDKGPVKRGLGAAQSVWGRFVDMNSACEVRLHADGSVELVSSVADLGTGTRTAVAQIVAEELGLRAADITVRIGDTQFPQGPGSGGSKTLLGISPAVRLAAFRARKRLLDLAAPALGVAASDLSLKGGKVVGPGGKSLAWKAACARIGGGTLAEQASRPADYGTPGRDGYGGVQFAEVAVDTQTGIIRVERIVAVHDCGRVINPLAVQSQINGGVLHGVSYALYEDRQMDANTGRMVNPTLDTYKIAGARETPTIEVVLLDQYQGKTNTDVNGIGEPANAATAAAIANAVYDAIGVRIRELPMRPAVVLAALAAGHPAR